jgi:fluoride exporter
MTVTSKIILLALAGAAGTLARAGLSSLVERTFGPRFPWGTLSVNLVGCLLFGVVWAAAESRLRVADIRLVALTGFMGAFTTFSTYVFELAALGKDGRFGAALGSFVVHNAAGVIALILGLALGAKL